jgi:hypothetical protein
LISEIVVHCYTEAANKIKIKNNYYYTKKVKGTYDNPFGSLLDIYFQSLMHVSKEPLNSLQAKSNISKCQLNLWIRKVI